MSLWNVLLLSVWVTIFQGIKSMKSLPSHVFFPTLYCWEVLFFAWFQIKVSIVLSKKKKKGNILILFIYSVVATDFQHKCKLKYSLLLSFFLTHCTDNSFELGANTDVTKNNPTWCLSWAPVFYNISLPQPYLYSSLLQILLHNNLVSWRAHGPLKWLNFVSLG